MSPRARRNLRAALVGVLLLGVASCGGAPATRKAVDTPEVGARLGRLKYVIDRRVIELNARTIDGRPRYDKARAAVAAFISYCDESLDGNLDEQKTRELLAGAGQAEEDFLAWSDEQLKADKDARPEPLPADELADELVRFWRENDKGWRQAAAVEIREGKLKDWDDVIKRPPGVMP